MKIFDPNKFTGLLICYSERAEMDKVHARLKDLTQKDHELKDVILGRAFNPNDVPYPWTIGLLVTDAEKLQCLDDYLTDNNIDLGQEKELYAGEPRALDFFRMLPLDGKYEPGIVKIRTGTCPRNPKATSPLACTFCPTGHLLECHFPQDCATAKCSHLYKYDEKRQEEEQ